MAKDKTLTKGADSKVEVLASLDCGKAQYYYMQVTNGETVTQHRLKITGTKSHRPPLKESTSSFSLEEPLVADGHHKRSLSASGAVRKPRKGRSGIRSISAPSPDLAEYPELPESRRSRSRSNSDPMQKYKTLVEKYLNDKLKVGVCKRLSKNQTKASIFKLLSQLLLHLYHYYHVPTDKSALKQAKLYHGQAAAQLNIKFKAYSPFISQRNRVAKVTRLKPSPLQIIKSMLDELSPILEQLTLEECGAAVAGSLAQSALRRNNSLSSLNTDLSKAKTLQKRRYSMSDANPLPKAGMAKSRAKMKSAVVGKEDSGSHKNRHYVRRSISTPSPERVRASESRRECHQKFNGRSSRAMNKLKCFLWPNTTEQFEQRGKRELPEQFSPKAILKS